MILILKIIFFHAIDENTPKNGVLTAIEDFLMENSSIGIMDLYLLNGITILYLKNSISHIRLNKLLCLKRSEEISLEKNVRWTEAAKSNS